MRKLSCRVALSFCCPDYWASWCLLTQFSTVPAVCAYLLAAYRCTSTARNTSWSASLPERHGHRQQQLTQRLLWQAGLITQPAVQAAVGSCLQGD